MNLNKSHRTWGTWVAQSMKRPTSARVMISRFVTSGPTSGSVLTARGWSLFQIPCLPLSLARRSGFRGREQKPCRLLWTEKETRCSRQPCKGRRSRLARGFQMVPGTRPNWPASRRWETGRTAAELAGLKTANRPRAPTPKHAERRVWIRGLCVPPQLQVPGNAPD